MTHASLCKRTYANSRRFHGTLDHPVWLRMLAILIFLASANILSAQINIITTSLPGANLGVPYSAQLKSSGGVAPTTWGLCSDCPSGGSLPPGLALDANTGIISGTPTAIGVSRFTVQVEDADLNSATAVLSIAVTPCQPTVNPASPLPSGDVGVSYLVRLVATGCPGPFTYSALPAGANTTLLPPGLGLTNYGSIQGTPNTPGTYEFTLTLTDPNKQVTGLDYTITINAAPSVSTASPLPNGFVGVPYSQQIAATGGSPPYSFSMNNNPPGLTISSDGVLSGTPTKVGTYSFNIGVSDSLRGQTVSPFQVTFENAASQIQVSPLSLTFNADVNGDHPPTQAVSIVPASGATLPINFHLVVDTGTNNTTQPGWITVTPANGAVPAGLVVSANQGNLTAGSYPARIQVIDGNGYATDVAVTLNVASTPQKLTVAPAILNFAARAATPGTLVENLVLSTTGGPPLGFTTSVAGKSSWITSVTSNSSTTSQNQPVFVQVQVNTGGLKEGSYNDAILVSSSAGNTTIPVSLFVAASGPILAVNTTGVLFQAVAGGGSTATRTVKVLDLGDPSSTVNWSASLNTGSNWLTLVTSSGTATSTTPGSLTLALASNATGLAPGPYYATVKIVDTNSKNSPQYVTAVLNLEPSGSAPSPDLSPGGLFFTTTAGGLTPAAQQVQVNTSSATPATFDAAVTTTPNGTWLSATPPSGSASGVASGSITVSVSPSGLVAGIYTGYINVSIGSLLESVNVTFVVQPAGSAGAAIPGFRPEVTGCTASKLAITETGLDNNFSVPAGWPATLIVQLNNDCAAAVNNGSVIASFSNGDAPLNLAGDSLGNYSATWQPGAINSNMVVTLDATAPNLAAARAKLYGGIATNQTPPPTLSPNGTVNNLNPAGGAALAPGTIAQVYGTGLASESVSPGLPLPTSFNNTFALIGPAQAPLYFLSSGQINLQIPNEATATQQLPIVLSVNNAVTLPLMLNIVPAAPGILSANDGPTPPQVQNGAHLIAQRADGSLVGSTNPAKPGETLVMYAVGLGATNPGVGSGAVTPDSPLHYAVVQPVVTVGSHSAAVAFAGLTPGYVGLYQINFQVPAGATTGNLEVDVSQDGVAANPTVLPVAQ